MVITHDEDDVVPPELSHQVEPHLGLVGVGRHGPEEGQVDTLHTEERRGEGEQEGWYSHMQKGLRGSMQWPDVFCYVTESSLRNTY